MQKYHSNLIGRFTDPERPELWNIWIQQLSHEWQEFFERYEITSDILLVLNLINHATQQEMVLYLDFDINKVSSFVESKVLFLSDSIQETTNDASVSELEKIIAKGATMVKFSLNKD